MLHGSKVSSTASHLVPCVVKAVQIIEALRTAQSGLRVEDFVGATGYARSTVYRILRTLMACDYVRRDRRGAKKGPARKICFGHKQIVTRSAEKRSGMGVRRRSERFMETSEN